MALEDIKEHECLWDVVAKNRYEQSPETTSRYAFPRCETCDDETDRCWLYTSHVGSPYSKQNTSQVKE